MSKQIHYGDEARKKIYEWVRKVADAVKVTMWPKWKNVILERSYWAPTVTNDWVTVAKEIELEDKLENIGAELVKEAANKTNDVAWDWTTTTSVLVDWVAKEWLRYVNSGVNPFALGRGLNKAVEVLVAELANKAKVIDTKEEIRQVATISAQDESVGQLIAEVMEEVGKDWVITVEEWKTLGLQKDIVKGMQFDQGYVSPYFVTNPDRMETVIERPLILVTDKKITSIKEILSVLEGAAAMGRKDFVIIAEDIEGEALATLILNKIRGVLNVLAVKAPGFGDRKKEMLKDIAVVTWAELISEELGLKLDSATVQMLGQAEKVITNKDKTTIVGWFWDNSLIEGRAQQIRVQIANTSSDYDKEKLSERLARLVGWVAVIKVGAATEMEMKNKKYKIEDALNATRAAIQEWIVTWGGTALLKLISALDAVKLSDTDEQVGVEIIKKAIEYPARQIAYNAGFKGDLVVEKVKENKDFNYGFNAKTWEYQDLMKAWVIDPVKVIRVALQESVSAAGMLLTTDAVISDTPKKEDNSHADMGWMWWMGGMWMWWMWGMM